MQSLIHVIDKAADLCGGQNALARRLGTTSGSMSDWKSGKRSIPDHQIQAIAQLVGIEPADLWLIAQQARNPFKVSAHALLSALLAAFVAAILPGTPNAADARSTRDKTPINGPATDYSSSRIRRSLQRVLAMLGFGRART